MRVPQRGRAILRRLSAQDSVRAFRPGDFVLTQSDGGLARVLGWTTGSTLNHAALIIDPMGTVIEANPNLLTDARAYRLSSVATYLRSGKPCWVGYVELREGTRQEVVDYAEHLLRAQSGATLPGRLWLMAHAVASVAPVALTARVRWLHPLRAFFVRHALVLREEYCYASAELVARALERGGFIWDRDPAHITPAELHARYALAESPAELKPTPIALWRRARRAGAAASSAPRGETTGAITPFAPRGTRGATALAEAPEGEESPQAAVRAFIQVGMLVAAGLAILGMLEEVLRSVSLDA
jgi:hypothetical protein